MNLKSDLTGKVFGQWTMIGPDPSVEPQYGEQCEEERPDEDEWPSEQECLSDLDHE